MNRGLHYESTKPDITCPSKLTALSIASYADAV